MLLSVPARRGALLYLFLPVLIVGAGAMAFAQESKLGKVDFPTTGAPAAQAHFLRGVAALHSFWYEEALEEFQAATKTDPDFMMGYWGEAMTYNHPLWAQQDTDAGRKTIAKIRDMPKLTERERAYLDAIRKLYGEGNKLARDEAYAAAMKKLYSDYADDAEAACFYALSLLGTIRPGEKGFRRQMLAGSIALEVYRKNPDHPGAAHYIIHAFDDPEHAILALDAARRYSRIAPEAHHARHMPAHIFLQLGMWPEAAASNESAWAVSDAWVKRKNLPIEKRDYHSLHWLLYVYLQQGRQRKAEELISVLQDSIRQAGDERKLGRSYRSDMAAAFIIETGRWELADKLLNVQGAQANGQGSATQAAPMSPAHCAPPPTAGARANSYLQSRDRMLASFVKGLAAASNNSQGVEQSIAELRALRGELAAAGELYRAKQVEIMEMEVSAASSSAKGSNTEAIELIKRAASLEEEMSPPSGPPELIKPSHELFGEILLRAGRPKEAAQEFKVSLQRQPNRALSLLGAARAASGSGNVSEAVAIYTSLLKLWSQADSQSDTLREPGPILLRLMRVDLSETERD